MHTYMQVLQGTAGRPRSPLRSAYEHFRVELQGDLVSPKTLDFYGYMLEPFLGWLEAEHPEAVGFEDLDVNLVRAYRAELAGRPGPRCRPLAPKSLAESHKALLTFLRWAQREGYPVNARCLALRRPRVPEVNDRGHEYDRFGLDAIMDRLQTRVGFHVHAHAFRHTFATVATKMGWNFEHLRAAMGHADYKTLQRYVRLATERDLGARRDWQDFVASNPASDWTKIASYMVS